MRLVRKDLTDIPDIFKQQSTLDDWEIIATGNPDTIKDAVYKGSYKDTEGKSQSSVRDKLNTYYYTKCAYCETFCKAEIEHYRPKKGVKEDNTHKGYYWLCYEWSNLVPSCRYCNTEGGKGNQFPIAVTGTRIYNPVIINGKLDKTKCVATDIDLKNECACLLHPEIDSPEIHLEFSWEKEKQGIFIKTLNFSEKGGETIKICNLNRENLRIERMQTVVHPIKEQMNILFTLIENKVIAEEKIPQFFKIMFSRLEEISNDEKLPHTLLRKFIISSHIAFERIVGNYFTNENQKMIIAEAFKAYNSGKL